MREYSDVASCGCVDDNGQVFPCAAHSEYGASPLDTDRIPLPTRRAITVDQEPTDA
jgi:hypothetical protein